METNFVTTTHAKAILAGEHAVLRGAPALVLPVREKFFRLSYTLANQHLPQADYIGSMGESLLVIFWHTLEKALNLINRSLYEVDGNFLLENHIPISAGMGFSAAICVAIARWCHAMGWIEHNHIFKFARRLEDEFHGKSSGVDIAGANASKTVHYEMHHQIIREIFAKWQPKLYLSNSNEKSITVKCIKQVEKIINNDPLLAKRIDLEMQQSVIMAEAALQAPEEIGKKQLQQAIEIANHCFQQWNLISPVLAQHMHELTSRGAIVKPSGAGYGGVVLSLWFVDPPADLPFELIPVKVY